MANQNPVTRNLIRHARSQKAQLLYLVESIERSPFQLHQMNFLSNRIFMHLHLLFKYIGGCSVLYTTY